MLMDNLFSIQRELRNHIGYNEPDRARCLQIAFIVELGECLNEWKGFKFWSKRRWSPNANVLIQEIDELTGYVESTKETHPLLEEYVDGLHFILELGIEYGHDKKTSEVWAYFPSLESMEWSALHQADSVFEGFYRFKHQHDEFDLYFQLMQLYLGLGQLFGFSERQIHDAYLAKNKINHERQVTGY